MFKISRVNKSQFHETELKVKNKGMDLKLHNSKIICYIITGGRRLKKKKNSKCKVDHYIGCHTSLS